MQPTSGIKTWQWVTTVVVIIVLIIIGILVFGNKGTPSEEPITPVTDNGATPGALNRIVMQDQLPGNVAYLTSVQLDKPGFVVIHADNNGVPGAILGQTYFTSGFNPGSIKLSKAMVNGGTYYAILNLDNGNAKWDGEAVDLPIKDASGNIIMKVFHSTTVANIDNKG